MLAFEPPLRVIGLAGDDAQLMWMGHRLAKSLLRAFLLTGAEVRVEGREHIVPGRRYIVVANHQGFSKAAAVGLLRSLAFEALDTARDADQLRRSWQQLDSADRRDAFVAARAATRMAQLGATDEGRQILRPFWDSVAELGAEDREVIAHGLVACVVGIGADWLPRLESASRAYPRDGAVAFATGCALAERQLWGKARLALQQAADDATLPAASRRRAWRQLAQLAHEEGDAARAADCYAAASQIG